MEDSPIWSLVPVLTATKPYVTTLAVTIARPVAIVVVFPVFSRTQIGRIVRTGIAIALILPIFTSLHETRLDMFAPGRVDEPMSDAFRLTVLAVKEFIVGFLLGIILSVPFWAIALVGELVDLQRGVTVSPMEDPASHEQEAATNTLITIAAITIFVSAGGLLITAGVLYESYRVWPLDTFLPQLDVDGFLGVGAILDHLFRYALLVGAPFLILFFVSDIAMGLLERFAPRISSFALAPIVKNLIFVGLLAVYASFLVGYIEREMASTHGVPDVLRSLLVGGEAR